MVHRRWLELQRTAPTREPLPTVIRDPVTYGHQRPQSIGALGVLLPHALVEVRFYRRALLEDPGAARMHTQATGMSAHLDRGIRHDDQIKKSIIVTHRPLSNLHQR